MNKIVSKINCLIKPFTALCFILATAVSSSAAAAYTTESGVEMVKVNGGWFEMGPPGGPRPRVKVDDFYMGKHPVTQASFQRIMGTNPSRWQNDANPMDSVTFAGAAEYCNRLSELEGLEPVYNLETWEINYAANGYRLPTEAEWEYAARGGTDSRFFWGDIPARIGMFAWVRTNSGERTRPVGRKLPNPFGLHDVYGNVAEWCNDFYIENHLPEPDTVNPQGPEHADMRVVRGGSWHSGPDEANSYHREGVEPGYADICTAGYDVYGFRIVRSAGED